MFLTFHPSLAAKEGAAAAQCYIYIIATLYWKGTPFGHLQHSIWVIQRQLLSLSYESKQVCPLFLTRSVCPPPHAIYPHVRWHSRWMGFLTWEHFKMHTAMTHSKATGVHTWKAQTHKDMWGSSLFLHGCGEEALHCDLWWPLGCFTTCTHTHTPTCFEPPA